MQLHTAQHSTALHCTAQHSTAQHSTAQRSAAQFDFVALHNYLRTRMLPTTPKVATYYLYVLTYLLTYLQV